MRTLPYKDACVLVLGTGPRAGRARELLAQAGAKVVRRFGSSVTYVVIDRSVPAGDSQVAAARRAAVPVLTTGELQRRPGMEALAQVKDRRHSGSASRPRGPMPGGVVPVSAPGAPVSPGASAADLWRRASRRSRRGMRLALLSLGTLGFATPLSVGYGAYRLRSWGDGAAAIGYSLLVSYLTVLFINGVAWEVVVALMAWIVFWCGGAIHAYLLGKRMADPAIAAKVSPLWSNPLLAAKDAANAAALEAAEHRRGLREKARELVSENPMLAKELRIGRPDRSRSFDDGGLVDVNAVSEAVLRRLPGVDAKVAGEIIRWRQVHGSFESCDELVVHTSLDPRAVERLEQVALFMPR